MHLWEIPRRYDVLIAGFGGQRVLLAGNLLSYAAMVEGKKVCYFPSTMAWKKEEGPLPARS